MNKKDKNEIYSMEEYGFSVNPRQLTSINSPTPAEVLQIRKGRGGLEYVYVKTSWVIAKLNEIFGLGWDFEILEQTPVEIAVKLKQIIVKGKLTAKDKFGRTISKTQFGSAEVKFLKGCPRDIEHIVDIADDYKAAASDALKKCASMLGIALDVYSGEFTPDDVKEGKPENIVDTDVIKHEKPEEEWKFAISNKQLKFLWSLAKQKGLDEESVHKIIKDAWGYESVKDLKSRQEFDDLLDFIDPEGAEYRKKVRSGYNNGR